MKGRIRNVRIKYLELLPVLILSLLTLSCGKQEEPRTEVKQSAEIQMAEFSASLREQGAIALQGNARRDDYNSFSRYLIFEPNPANGGKGVKIDIEHSELKSWIFLKKKGDPALYRIKEPIYWKKSTEYPNTHYNLVPRDSDPGLAQGNVQLITGLIKIGDPNGQTPQIREGDEWYYSVVVEADPVDPTSYDLISEMPNPEYNMQPEATSAHGIGLQAGGVLISPWKTGWVGWDNVLPVPGVDLKPQGILLCLNIKNTTGYDVSSFEITTGAFTQSTAGYFDLSNYATAIAATEPEKKFPRWKWLANFNPASNKGFYSISGGVPNGTDGKFIIWGMPLNNTDKSITFSVSSSNNLKVKVGDQIGKSVIYNPSQTLEAGKSYYKTVEILR